jgi:L-ascorbate metabolism protein UlaG (beta-lactamase superfamily)
MEIRFHGSNTFEIETGVSRVVMDPFPKFNISGVVEGALVTTMSHVNESQIGVGKWAKKSQVISDPGEFEVAGLAFRGVATPRSDDTNPRGLNTVYTMDAEGMTVCHLGHLSSPLSSQAQQMLGKVDILIVPAGGPGNIGPEEAATTLRQLEPRIVIPVFAGNGDVAAATQALGRLISEIGVQAGDPLPRLTIARTNLPAEMRVVLLRPAA